MNKDYTYMLFKYSASYIQSNKLLQECQENLYDIQNVYISDSNRVIDFNPILFFAQNMERILKHKNVTLAYAFDKQIPYKIISDDLILFTNGYMNNLHVTRFYIRYFFDFENVHKNLFSATVYYSQYFESIEKKFSESSLSTADKAALFFVEYGYWKNLNIDFISPLQFICSVPQYITLDNDVEILTKYFEAASKEDIKFMFDPFVYFASNINEFEQVFETIDNFDKDDEMKLLKHYINVGHSKKKPIDSFPMYDYLASNPKFIKEILSDCNSCFEWDYLLLTKRTVAIHYIRNKKRQTKSFNAVKFVQENIGCDSINWDKKLSIENASRYFVEHYIKSKQLRYHNSVRYKLGVFCSQRVKDSLRTLPLSISRCFISIPLI